MNYLFISFSGELYLHVVSTVQLCDGQQFEAHDGHAALPHASPATRLPVTVSEMSATFIKRKVPEGVGVTAQPIITASGRNQVTATVLPRGGHSAVSGQSHVQVGDSGGQLGHHPAENQNATPAGAPWAWDSIPPVCSLFLCFYYCLSSTRTVTLVVEDRAGKGHKGWGRGSHGGPD